MANLMDTWPYGYYQALFYALGVTCGIIIHYSIFIHGEWHIQAPHIIISHASTALFLILGSRFAPDETAVVCGILNSIFWGYLPGIVLSIIFYRVFFHRLTKAGFPGPWYAPMSKIWHVWAARKSQNHLVLAKLHERYGDFVRTGPAEVTIFTPDVFMKTDGPGNKCVKSEFYDLLEGINYPALVNTRVGEIHAARRREWRPGFSAKALQLYESRILPHLDEFDRLIEADAISHRPSSLRDYMYWFGFDAMGEFVFSNSFSMLENRDAGPIITRLQNALSILGPLTPTPWLLHVGLRMAPRVGVVKDWYDTLEWCSSQMRCRLNNARSNTMDNSREDLAHYLMEDNNNKDRGTANGRNGSLSWLTGDSLLAIVAGSDPTTVTLIGLFAELAKHPVHAEKILEEVADVDVRDFRTLSGLPHLNGVIKETLRLYPSLLSGGSRKTQENGITIGGRLIPPFTTIVCPRYSINRRADCFEKPLDFIPERWTTSPNMIKNKNGYTPFGTGMKPSLRTS
ncbi:hypothetical protein VMCG_09091 [Cytospora schulzeri]|uniref:Cytochrome P450 n=1 Tax=Cytospora schulzeri TaxID=448051 RepID=A0A423VP62_9PEZI|nr:hypothetical protein VMCG_09091 [Valsa malicola]